jgi:hypothetical protein
MYTRKHHKKIVRSGGAAPDGKIPFPLMTKGERFIRCRGQRHGSKGSIFIRCRGQRHGSRGSMSEDELQSGPLMVKALTGRRFVD